MTCGQTYTQGDKGMIYSGPAVSIQRLEHDIAVLRFKVPQDNTFLYHCDFFNDLETALDYLDQERHISGLLLLDLQCPPVAMCQYYQQQLQHQDTEATYTYIQTQLNRIEDYSFPTVALIGTYTFGPMADIALCCDYRLATSQAQLFFAAQSFGQTPCLGSSVRLPRLIGLEQAITTLQHHTPYRCNDLIHIGLADAQITIDDTLDSAIRYLQVKQQLAKPLDKVQPIKLTQMAQFMVFEQVRALTYSHASLIYYPTHKILLDSLEQSINNSRIEAQQIELQAYLRTNQLWQTAPLTIQACSQYMASQVPPLQLKQAATVVNHYRPWITTLLQHDVQIHISDTGQDFDYNSFQNTLKQACRDLTLDVTTGIQYSRYTPLSHEIQCVFDLIADNINTKVARLNQLRQQLAKECIILVESPVISSQTLADQLEQPEHILVMHQSASPHKKPLVELTSHSQVSAETENVVRGYLQQLGKVPLFVNPQNGLFSQYIIATYANVLSELINESVDFAHIDAAMQHFGFLEGPATLLDRIGLKQYVYIEKKHYDKQAQIAQCIRYMVDQGHFGKSQGFGFYRYDNTTQEPKTHHTIYDLLYGERPFHVMDDQQIIDRFLIALSHTTLEAINNGLVNNAQEADLALVHGFGFPDFYVWPCYYIQHIGIAKYIALCNQYTHLGDAYCVPAQLKTMLEQQQLFYTQGVV